MTWQYYVEKNDTSGRGANKRQCNPRCKVCLSGKSKGGLPLCPVELAKHDRSIARHNLDESNERAKRRITYD